MKHFSRFPRWGSKPHHPERGQSLVEFSTMLILMLILLAGTVDLGRAYFTYLALKDASGEGAYFAAAYPQCTNNSTGYSGCDDPNNIEYRIKNSSPKGSMVYWADAQITVTTTGNHTPTSDPKLKAGELVTVSVSYIHTTITPLMGGQNWTLKSYSVATIIRVPNCEFAECQ